ncbi:hypothetical protein EON63_24185 [archaeon]|nr:MAG: hypothetical protein EON63_24185 [archaeon]
MAHAHTLTHIRIHTHTYIQTSCNNSEIHNTYALLSHTQYTLHHTSYLNTQQNKSSIIPAPYLFPAAPSYTQYW